MNGQPAQFQFVIAAMDGSAPVTDLTRDEIVYAENGAQGTIVKLEPYAIPVKLTIAIDNGLESRDAIAHYRTSLTALVNVLPCDIEVALISTAPQPYNVVRPTTNRTQILRGINGFAPEEQRPRFTDVIVEYARRLERELQGNKPLAYIPVLVMVSTTANEVSSYQVREVERALQVLVARRAKLLVVMISTRSAERETLTDMNTNRQAIIGIPATRLTGGRYEALAVSSRLTSLLPEFAKEIRALHVKHTNQLRVTVERPNGLTGPFQNLRVEIGRPGLTGTVSGEGLP